MAATNGIINLDVTSETLPNVEMRVVWYATPHISLNTTTINFSFEVRINHELLELASLYNTSMFLYDVNGNRYYKYGLAGTTKYITRNSWDVIDTAEAIIAHDERGRVPTLYVNAYIGAKSVQIEGSNTEATIVLEPINQHAIITSAINFTEKQNPSFEFSNPMEEGYDSLQACISSYPIGVILPWRDVPKTVTQFTFVPTVAEWQALKDATVGNTLAVNYVLRSKLGDIEYDSIVTKVFTIEGKPQINPTIKDVDTATLALTGDENTMVRYFSDAAITFGTTSGSDATIVQQQVSCGGKSRETNGTLTDVESGTFVFTATDSRDVISSLTIHKTLIPYVKLTCNPYVTTSLDGAATVTIKGNYFNGSFGAVDNTLTLQYRYKVEGGSYGSWVTISDPTYSNDTYSATVDLTISKFDYQKNYVFQVRTVDKLMTVIKVATTVITPVYDWSKTDFNFNVPITYTEGEGVYSVSDAAKSVSAVGEEAMASVALLPKLVKAMTQRHELTCYVYPSTYYSKAEVSLYLYGNTIRGYMTATRNEQVAAGNVANELVCQVEFDSGGKVIGFGQVGFTTGTEGGIATLQMTDTLIYLDVGSVSPEAVGRGVFYIRLCATATAGSQWNAYFAFPALLDLNKF